MEKQDLIIEGATLMFKNFTGKAQQYNAEGDRNFCLALDPETAERLKADGWNIRMTKPRDPNDPPIPYTKVKVRFDNYPPKIYLHSGASTVQLTEDLVSQLDFAEIINVDLDVSPYNWTKGGMSGVTGYLKLMHVTIREDPFAKKYANPSDEGDIPW